MTDVTVRPATPEDVPGILRVAEAGWNATYGDILAQETIDRVLSDWYDEASTHEYVEDPAVAYFVALDDGTVRGYVSGSLAEDPDVAILAAIYVDPDYWGSGIGSALLDRFERYCRERDRDVVELEVLGDNEVGISFYRSRGYESVASEQTDLFDETVEQRRFRGRLD